MSGMIGMGLQAAGGIYGGIKAKQTADYNAAVAKQEAKTEKVLTDIAIQRHRRAAKKLKGAQIAAYGASGVTLEGSPILVIADSAADAELDEALIKFEGMSRVGALKREAKMQKEYGRSALYGALISAGQSAVQAYAGRPKPEGSSLLSGTGGRPGTSPLLRGTPSKPAYGW